MSDDEGSTPASPNKTKTSLRGSTNPDLLRPTTAGSQADAADKKFSVFQEDDEFLRKWSGPLLLGPFLVAIFSLITIVGGHLVLNTWDGYCGYALDSFVAAAVTMSYFFLIVYAWAFLGHHVHVMIPGLNIRVHILRPFRTLKMLSNFYFVLGFLSFCIWIWGSALLTESIFCIDTAPELYNFSLYLVVTFWVGFFIIGCYLIKLKFGNFIGKFVSNQAKGPSVEDMEERIFRKEFKKLDKNKSGTLPQELLPDFFVRVAVFIPEEEMPGVLKEIGVLGGAEVEFFELLEWYKKYNARMAGYAGDDPDDDNDDATASKKPQLLKLPSSGGGKADPPSRAQSVVSES